jgi:hypothetical protein
VSVVNGLLERLLVRLSHLCDVERSKVAGHVSTWLGELTAELNSDCCLRLKDLGTVASADSLKDHLVQRRSFRQ